MSMKALIFDCDGVLVDTERDGHRVAFNQAFAKKGIDADWDVATYGKLLEVAGGKERMKHFFNETGWPPISGDDRDTFIADLHALKSSIYKELIESGQLSLRPGINRIVDEARGANLRLAVCSTSKLESVLAVMDLMGAERKSWFEQVLAGDVVSRKKPDPEVYLLVLERLGLEPGECVVVEDSQIGMTAALAAGMHCIVTTSVYTATEDFSGADRVVSELGDSPGDCVTIEDLKAFCA